MRRREGLPITSSTAQSTLALPQKRGHSTFSTSRPLATNGGHEKVECPLFPTTANILSATRLPHRVSASHRDAESAISEKLPYVCGPWFCVPALRLVCLFEDDNAAGPCVAELRFAFAPKREIERSGEEKLCAAHVLAGTCQGADACRASCLHTNPMSTAGEVKRPT